MTIVPDEKQLTYRDMLRVISPPWLQQGLNEKILYAFGVHIDGFGDALSAGVQLRFPNYYSPESLGLIGRERRIRRGVLETDAVYANRLTRWLIDHQRRGGPYALLSQLYAHYATAPFAIDLIYRNGRKFSMDVSGNITMSDVAFNPDGVPEQWARWWLFYHTDSFGTPTDADKINIRLVPKEWAAQHIIGTIIIFPSGSELINSAGTIDQAGTIDTAVSAIPIAVDD
jgi:hypothetical protein